VDGHGGARRPGPEDRHPGHARRIASADAAQMHRVEGAIRAALALD
jgi:hypothetical protein